MRLKPYGFSASTDNLKVEKQFYLRERSWVNGPYGSKRRMF